MWTSDCIMQYIYTHTCIHLCTYTSNLKRWMFWGHGMCPQRFSKIFSQPQPPAQTRFEVWQLIWALFKLPDTIFCHCFGSGLFLGNSKWQMLSIFTIFYSIILSTIFKLHTTVSLSLKCCFISQCLSFLPTYMHILILWNKETSLLISIFKYLKLAILLEQRYC